MNVVDGSASGTNPPATQAYDRGLQIQGENEHGTKLHTMFLQQLKEFAQLSGATRKAIKQNDLLPSLFEFCRDDVHDTLRGNQASCGQVRFDSPAQRRQQPNFRFQQIASFNDGHAVARGQRLNHRCLAASRRTYQYRRVFVLIHMYSHQVSHT